MTLALALAGCGADDRDAPQGGSMQAGPRPVILETVGDFAIVPLYADGFEDLTPRQRALAFYLCRAALAGRDITYDQMGRYNLEVRDLLEEIVTHPRDISPPLLAALQHYLKLFWINNGNHNDRTKEKFLPGFTFEELHTAALLAVRDRATIELALNESLGAKLNRLRGVIFDPAVEPLVTCKSPPEGSDILSCSSVNYYDGVALADLEGFAEKNGLNSRLVKRDGRLEEEIYRAGRDGLPPGRYAAELSTINGFLAKAGGFAGAAQRSVLQQLIEHFTTGDLEAFRRYNIAWVADDFEVDTINGFIEVYKDPRSRKGAWEGMVYFVDRATTDRHKRLAALAQHFEDRAPWSGEFKRHGFNPPVANAVTLLLAVGDAGPMPPIGVNLPNEEAISERYGNKSISLINLIDAGNRALQAKILAEFALPEDRPLLERYGAEVAAAHTAMHEILGHAAGKVRDSLAAPPQDLLREHYATLEEARAELVALHHVFDPKLQEIGLISSSAAAEAAWRDYVAADLSMLRRVRGGDRLQDDHMRARHLIVSYLRDVAGAVETVRRDGRSYFRVRDLAVMRRGIAELLAELQRIKAEGDYGAAGDLMRRFATRIDTTLRDEIVARADAAGLPSYLAFVMPDIIPIRDASGEVVDARIDYGSDFTGQMLRYSRKRPLEADTPR
ncbi:MAG TPA: peptidase M49 [Candidatus Polarisedimenticolia bacterium]|nr:peptidase M49 [Candidatus Polarisedimenticolia bacterium]